MNRRHFLRAAGICLGLPALESLGQDSNQAPRRFIGINNTLGFHLPHLVPATAGRDYEMTPYLKHLERHRQNFSFISGVMHQGVDGGHAAESSFLSGAPHPGSPNFRNSLSLDQRIAQHYEGQTRLPYLCLRTTADGGKGQSCNSRGQVLTADEDPRRVFAKMCFSGNDDDTQRVIASLAHDHSLLDHLLDDTQRLTHRVTAVDKQRLDEYFTALREVERDLQRERTWADKPKPKETYHWPKTMPVNVSDIVKLARLHLDMSALAFRTDATRSISLKIFGTGARPPTPGVTESYHGLSHHGQDEAKIAQLAIIEGEILKAFALFLDQLTTAKNADGTSLLDSTSVLFGSSMGNASSHNNSELPIFIAGGGFKHGQHLAFNKEKAPPLCDLFVSILQRTGIEVDTFSSGSRPLGGLEV
jgi:hypothetical protein